MYYCRALSITQGLTACSESCQQLYLRAIARIGRQVSFPICSARHCMGDKYKVSCQIVDTCHCIQQLRVMTHLSALLLEASNAKIITSSNQLCHIVVPFARQLSSTCSGWRAGRQPAADPAVPRPRCSERRTQPAPGRWPLARGGPAFRPHLLPIRRG